MLVDGAFTPGLDQVAGLALAIAWLFGLVAATSLVFTRIAMPARS